LSIRKIPFPEMDELRDRDGEIEIERRVKDKEKRK
jgi:hypothetical protein